MKGREENSGSLLTLSKMASTKGNRSLRGRSAKVAVTNQRASFLPAHQGARAWSARRRETNQHSTLPQNVTAQTDRLQFPLNYNGTTTLNDEAISPSCPTAAKTHAQNQGFLRGEELFAQPAADTVIQIRRPHPETCPLYHHDPAYLPRYFRDAFRKVIRM